MKAILLAAGLGTRLRPITDTMPKCLVPILGRPLLAWWFALLEEHGVTDVLINLHHFPEQVEEFVVNHNGAIEVELAYEQELLGSAGTLYRNQAFFADADQFFILYADNLTDVNLSALARFNADYPSSLTMGLFHAENPSACGIAELDDNGTILSFIEKPENPKSDLASAGVFVARPGLFKYLRPDSYPYDFGRHVMSNLLGEMNGVLVDGYLRDIGTLEGLTKAEKEWKQEQLQSR